MKCSDIPDQTILSFLADHQGTWATLGGDGSIMPNVALAFPPDTPPKVKLAKMRKLIERGLSGGCPCGCRGDYEITDKGLKLIGRQRVKPYTGY